MNFSVADERWSIAFPAADLVPGKTFYVALRTGNELGSAVIPFAENFEGSTVFLAFQADRLYFVQIEPESGRAFARRWDRPLPATR